MLCSKLWCFKAFLYDFSSFQMCMSTVDWNKKVPQFFFAPPQIKLGWAFTVNCSGIRISVITRIRQVPRLTNLSRPLITSIGGGEGSNFGG